MTTDEVRDKRARSQIEKEANYFALALLMPREMFKKELDKTVWDLTSDEPLKELAAKFQCSTTAVAVRMSMLGYRL